MAPALLAALGVLGPLCYDLYRRENWALSHVRFDPASALYALFGAFYVGIRFQPSDLGTWLSGTLPA